MSLSKCQKTLRHLVKQIAEQAKYGYFGMCVCLQIFHNMHTYAKPNFKMKPAIHILVSCIRAYPPQSILEDVCSLSRRNESAFSDACCCCCCFLLLFFCLFFVVVGSFYGMVKFYHLLPYFAIFKLSFIVWESKSNV